MIKAKIEKVSISSIKENAANPRTINKHKFQKLVNSVKEFPEMLSLRPIIVDKDNVILGGNMRYKACKELGIKEVYIIQAADLDDKQAQEFIVKDNVGFGEWDWDILANDWDVKELEEWGLDGFPFEEEVLEAEEDDYTEPDNMQVDVILGDLIEIGEHRLLCGDSTDSDQVAKLMDGEKADMVFTDPPYGENIDFSYLGHTTKLKHKSEIIKNDDLSGERLSDFLSAIYSNLKLFNKGAYYICSGWKQLPIFQSIFNHSMLIVWNKKQLGFGMGDYRNQTEFILYNKNKGVWNGDNSQRNIYEVNRENDNKLHPTIKPVELLTTPINNSSNKNNIVLDVFLGSGSTMVAAHQLKRKCYGMELDPKYCQVIIDRMLKLDDTLIIKRNGKQYNSNNS